MMPIGAAIGGLIVRRRRPFADRDWALRATWFADAAIHVGLFVFGRAKLTTDEDRSRAGRRCRPYPAVAVQG